MHKALIIFYREKLLTFDDNVIGCKLLFSTIITKIK